MMKKLTAADGHTLDCWMVSAEGERRGGLVILQEIFGVTDQLKELAARYASNGYEVAVPALFDRRERGVVIPFDQGPRGLEMMQATRIEDTMVDIDAAVQELSGKGAGVIVMGFCWGGGLAVRSAQKLDIAGAVAFYATRLSEYLDCPLKAPVLGHFGTQDGHTPQELLDEARAYLPEMEVYMYEAGHAFANDARAEYVAGAAELAHERSEVFMRKVIGAD